MSPGVAIRWSEPGDVPACVQIVRRLPDFFTPNVPDDVARDMAAHRTWVATIGHHVVGFVVVSTRHPNTAEVLWAAVEPGRRGQGVGTQLIARTMQALAADGIRLVQVKTLDPSADYEPYEATYAFWAAHGFVQIDRIDPPATWDQTSPAAVLVRALDQDEGRPDRPSGSSATQPPSRNPLPSREPKARARDVAEALFARLGSGAAPEELAGFFAEDVDWLIPGDTEVVPWIGRKTGLAGVTEFYRQLREMTVPRRFAVEAIVGDGLRCVVLGSLETEVLATGRGITSDFAFDIVVHDGLISRYHMFEDTWRVSRAVDTSISPDSGR